MTIFSHTFQVIPEDLLGVDTEKHLRDLQKVKDRFRTNTMVKIRTSLVAIIVFLIAFYLFGLHIKSFYFILSLSVLSAAVTACLAYLFMRRFDYSPGITESSGFKGFLVNYYLQLAKFQLRLLPQLSVQISLNFYQQYLEIIVPIFDQDTPIYRIFASATEIENESKKQGNMRFKLEYRTIKNIQERPKAWIVQLKSGLMQHRFLVLPKRVFLKDEIDLLKSRIFSLNI